MVSTFERQICFGGIFSLYAYTAYTFVKSKYSFNRKFHDALIIQGAKFENEINNPNFKFIHTPNEKVLFLFGVENNKNAFTNENMKIVDKVLENFTPNYIAYERDLKYSNKCLEDNKDKIIKSFEKIYPEFKKGKSSQENISDIQFIIKTLNKINQEERLKLFSELDNSVKDVSFEFFNLYTDNRRNNLSGVKCLPQFMGLEFLRIKSMIRKRLNKQLSKEENLEKDSKFNTNEYLNLNDISKMTMKDRIKYKEHQLEMNSKFNLYEDMKNYIKTEIKNEMEILNLKRKSDKSTLSTETQVNEIYNSVVIDEMNQIIINNLLDNKKLYIALVIVRQDRLNNLYDKLLDYNKNF